MKKIIPLFLLISLMATFQSFGQEEERALPTGDVITKAPIERVLEVPRMENAKVLPMFKEAFKNFSGVEFKGFCESRRLLFIKANPSGYLQVINYLREMNFEFFEKEDSSHQRAMNSCASKEEIKLSTATE